ncbi:hypothetical protein LPLAFNJD_LOCUS2301 [Methylorubrum aminovorans]
MLHFVKAEQVASPGCDRRCRSALAEAIGGLEIIRDEGPMADPSYLTHGRVEAYDAWGFDSASHKRSETARGTLANVAAILEGNTLRSPE